MAKATDIYGFDEFKQWLKGRFNSGAEIDYSSRLKRLNSDFISHLNTGTKYTPFELLTKYMTSSKKGPKKKLISSFLEALQSCITKKRNELKSCKNPTPSVAEFSNEQSAFRRYKEFLTQYLDSHPHRKDNICPTEKAVIATLCAKKIVWDKKDLLANFVLRISTQDRPSGDKTLLPLGLISQLKGKDLREWAKEEASKVIFHLSDKKVTTSDINNLYIDTDTGLTTIDITNGEEGVEVYNPPIDGVKSELRIFKLSDAHLDHRPEIHEILVHMKGQLPGLEYLTKAVRKAQKELAYTGISSTNVDKIYTKVLSDNEFKRSINSALIQQVIKDVRNVTSRHILQFASAKWNQSDIKQANKRSSTLLQRMQDS